MIVCVATEREDVVKVAMPPASVPVPMLAPPSRNVTVPVGVPAAGAVAATVAARCGNEIVLWAHDPKVAETIAATRANPLYLPQISIPENVRATSSLDEAAAFSDIYPGGGHTATGHYFKISGGGLKEILIAFTSQQKAGNAYGVGVPVAPVMKPTGKPLADIAEEFLKGLEKGDLSDVRLGPDVLVTENNEVKAHPKEAALKYWQEKWLGKVTKVTPLRWVIEGPDVVVFYEAEMREGRPQWVSQYFRIYEDLIRETWATFGGIPTAAERPAAGTAENRKP